MKKIILTSAIFINAILMNAQTIKVYEYDSEGNLNSTPAYTSTSKVKVVFEESVPDYKSQSLNVGDKVEGKIIVEGDTLTKGVGGTVADYVDLGMVVDGKKVLWATHNLGATTETGYGAYIAWGENGTKEDGYTAGVKSLGYSWSTLKYHDEESGSVTKYNVSGFANSSLSKVNFEKQINRITSINTVDNKTTLESEDDAATVNWGSDWRTPTNAELTALKDNCTWTWYESTNTDYNGVAGYKVTGTNGKSIFLPVAGLYYDENGCSNAGSTGAYWSSSVSGDMGFSRSLYFSYGYVNGGDDTRIFGFQIRPVRYE